MKKNIFITLLSMLVIANVYAQWPTDPKDFLRINGDGEKQISTITAGPHKGKTWVCWNVMSSQNETVSGQLIPVAQKATYVQLLDSNGNKLFGNNGMLVTKQRAGATFTTTGEKLFVDRDGNAIVLSVDGRNMTFDASNPRDNTHNQAQTFMYKIAPELVDDDLDFLWNANGVYVTNTVNGLEASQKMIQLTNTTGTTSAEYVLTIQTVPKGSDTRIYATYIINKTTGAATKTNSTLYDAMVANNDGTYFALTGSTLERRSTAATAMWNINIANKTFSAKPKKNNEKIKEGDNDVKAADGNSTVLVSDGKGGAVVLIKTTYNSQFIHNVAYFNGDGVPYFKNLNTDKAYIPVGSMSGYAQNNSSVVYEPITNSIYVGSVHFNIASQSWGYAAIQRINGADGTLEFGSYGKIIDGSPTMNQFAYPQVTAVPGCDSVYFSFAVNYGNPSRTYFPVYLVNHENENQWCAPVSMNKSTTGSGGKFDAASFAAGGVVYAWDNIKLNKVYLSGIVGNSDPLVCCGPGTGIDCPCVEGVNCLCDTTNCACDTCKLDDYCDPNSLCRTTCPNAGWYCDFCNEYCHNIDTCNMQECAGCPNAIYQACPTTAVGNESEITGMTITPNPAYETITIKVKEGEIVKTIDVYDMSGKMMMPRIFNPTNLVLSVRNLPAGSYTLVITTPNGAVSKVFIKK